jgi:hypothetical protein
MVFRRTSLRSTPSSSSHNRYHQLQYVQDRLEVSEYSFKTIFNYFVEALDKVNEDVAANFFVQVQIIGAAN